MRDRGSGTVVVVGIVAATVATALLLAPIGGAAVARARAGSAADAAALAAADTAMGFASGDPCEAADRVARANGAALDACVLDGPVATVRVRVAFGLLHASEVATAGPPGGA